MASTNPPTAGEIEEIRSLERPWCGDHSCRFGVPDDAGMGTNGGCRCFRERSLTESERKVAAQARSVPRLLAYIDHLEELIADEHCHQLGMSNDGTCPGGPWEEDPCTCDLCKRTRARGYIPYEIREFAPAEYRESYLERAKGAGG